MTDPMSIQKLLEELSSTGGGSLVKTVVKSEITPSEKILVIGLGGMGCKTVNAAKGVYLRDYKNTGCIDFLAVDTAINDMDDLNVQNGGNLTLNEMFQIYDSSADNLLLNRPPIVDSWLSQDAPKTQIIGDGAKQCRAVGRVMLCATPKYEALKTRINEKITALNVGANDILQVIIVAGISGGTGSGTFVDVSYMVRMLLDDLHANQQTNSKMFGVFYTPDVQKSIPSIGGNAATWANLQRNGYAALKDLDYFMNIGSQALTEDVYTIRTLSGTYTSHQRVFERGHVYIISPTNTCHICEDIVKKTAESLMDLFRQGATDGNAMIQSLISDLSNATTVGGTWDNLNVGAIADNALPADPCGIKNTLYPAFMNYNYSAFGVRSIYFPRNEMVAYCANEAFLAVYEEWKKAFEYTQDTVCAAAASCGIGGIDNIFDFVKAQLNISPDRFRIHPDESNYPVRKGLGSLLAKVEGTDDTITESTEKVNRAIKEITQPVCDNIINALANTIRSKFEDQNFLWQSGPFAAIVLLSGNQGQLKGFKQLLEDYANNIALAINAKKEAMDKAVNAVRTGKQTIDTDKNPHDDEIEAFVDLCQKYSEAYFEYNFYNRYMLYIINGVYSKINDFNNETFEIYVPIIRSVMDMLSADATAFANSTLKVNGNTTTYSLNAFDLNNARRQNNLFETLFNGYIDNNKVAAVKREFVASLFAPERKKKWQNIAGDPAALANEIRGIFKSVTDDLVSQMLEKLMIMVYGDKNIIINQNNGNANVTINDINNIWNDANLRINALSSAAKNIVEALTDSLMLKYEVDPTTSANFSKKATVILLNETPNLNNAIRTELANKFGATGFTVATMGDGTSCEYKTCITMAMSTTFIPLAMISHMRDYAVEYFKSETSVIGQAGRHLDEVTEKWQDNLPEIFGMDTEAYYVERGRINLIIPDNARATDEKGIRNQDKRMYDIIRDAVDYGIRNGYIWVAGNSFSLIKLTDTSNEFLKQIESHLLKMKATNPAAKWTDALREIENELHISKSKVINLDTDILNDKLKANQAIMPDNDFDLKNIYRLVRSDMRKVKLVVETKKFYEDTDFFYNMDNLAALQGNVALFIKALKIGAISYDENKGWFCKYSDSQYEPPVNFFDDYMRKNEQLDIPFKWYLAFSAFVKNVAGNDNFVAGIEEKYEQMQRDRVDYQAWDHVIAEIKEAMNSEIIRIRDAQERNKQLEPFYINSNYKEFYCVPKKYRSPQSLIDNFNKFVEELEYCKRYMNL